MFKSVLKQENIKIHVFAVFKLCLKFDIKNIFKKRRENIETKIWKRKKKFELNMNSAIAGANFVWIKRWTKRRMKKKEEQRFIKISNENGLPERSGIVRIGNRRNKVTIKTGRRDKASSTYVSFTARPIERARNRHTLGTSTAAATPIKRRSAFPYLTVDRSFTTRKRSGFCTKNRTDKMNAKIGNKWVRWKLRIFFFQCFLLLFINGC